MAEEEGQLTVEDADDRAERVASIEGRRLRMPIGKRVAISFNSYNPRRYSRPWIARIVAWHVGESGSVRALLCTRGVRSRCFHSGVQPPQIPEAPGTDMKDGITTFI